MPQIRDSRQHLASCLEPTASHGRKSPRPCAEGFVTQSPASLGSGAGGCLAVNVAVVLGVDAAHACVSGCARV